MKTSLTRSDCTRDNVKVYCPGTYPTIGFGLSYCKRGYWLRYEIDNHSCLGRSIGRVICEGKTFIEVAQVSLDFSNVYVRWIKPEDVREIRHQPPRSVFAFLAADFFDRPEVVFRALEYGVSDMRDQQGYPAWTEREYLRISDKAALTNPDLTLANAHVDGIPAGWDKTS